MSEELLPYSGPTRTTQITGRVLCVASYGLSFVVSMGALFAPSANLLSMRPRWWTVVEAIVLGVLSITGIAAVLSRLWRIEWVAATTIAFLLLERSVPMWGRVFSGSPESVSAASMMTLGAICLAQRALSLWIFAIKTRQAAELARESG